ncbi:hypothetical protein PUN28_013250 [Cardiocondyla obscurior]|uniref:Uncharacterized protein n=1 Tax=Cardiocondyla obscurior TaxID=286306 RepID=A0AAW2FAB8_9HYME
MVWKRIDYTAYNYAGKTWNSLSRLFSFCNEKLFLSGTGCAKSIKKCYSSLKSFAVTESLTGGHRVVTDMNESRMCEKLLPSRQIIVIIGPSFCSLRRLFKFYCFSSITQLDIIQHIASNNFSYYFLAIYV